MLKILSSKKCPKCNEVKPLSEFRKRSGKRSNHYRSHCKECENKDTRQRLASYRENEPERVAGYKKREYEKSKDKILARNKRNYQSHSEARRKWRKTYYKNNLLEIIRKALRWQKENPEKKQHIDRTRRARKSNAKGSFTKEEWANLCNKYGNVCLCCKQKKPLTADHVIPLSKGGTDYISNIQPLCITCNCRKGVNSTDYRR